MNACFLNGGGGFGLNLMLYEEGLFPLNMGSISIVGGQRRN